jgi:hypothetical protein
LAASLSTSPATANSPLSFGHHPHHSNPHHPHHSFGGLVGAAGRAGGPPQSPAFSAASLLPPGMNPFFHHAGMLHLPAGLPNPFQRFPSDPRMVGMFDPTKVRTDVLYVLYVLFVLYLH